MPRRDDLKKILLIGSGPIVIGQACEFDYSGTQALRALKEEGYEVVLVNSNPATIMTDPELSDRVYVEPLTPEFLTKVIERERPDAVLPTMGGQTALNLTLQLHDLGVLRRFGVEILGAKPEVIRKAEDRDLFKQTMDAIGCSTAKSAVARNLEDGQRILKEIGLPLILRPSFTLGGEGGGTAFTAEEFLTKLERALFLSPTQSVLVEESLLGWKEFEYEVVRDKNDNCIIICSIENLDPMGVHTGDSITVAPAMTLSDQEFQNLRDQSLKVIRAIGVETGGSNIQFAVNPKNGRTIVIEMNPRVSRSSALASKATGFPIARVAAKLAVGYTLDELKNDITKTTPACFEPAIDYVVVKIPRFDFEKFRPSEPLLSTQMKSVGEVMAMGRTFEEAFGKALAGIEQGTGWLEPALDRPSPDWERIDLPHARRLWAVMDAIRSSVSLDEIHQRSGIDSWFLDRLNRWALQEKEITQSPWPPSQTLLEKWKQAGWTDRALSSLLKINEEQIRQDREALKVTAAFLSVDTCAAEFEAKTPYHYSTYRGTNEAHPTQKPKVMILGGGPNRIGQGIEFDYCCVHAALALREAGYETLMVNSNPETVSTDFDTSDKLYFEPLTPEHVLAIAQLEKPLGVIVQLGGQTPLRIAKALERGGLKILGTSSASIEIAEDRKLTSKLLEQLSPLGLKQPPSKTALSKDEAILAARELGYPVLVRPSFVLGGRGMKILQSEEQLTQWIQEAIEVSQGHPVLIDRFLGNAIEVDVDALSDGKETVVCGVMEHIEEAGIHSGDSACTLPPVSLGADTLLRLREFTREIARHLNVIGLMNVQFAIQGSDIYVLEINPRASRTIPFISKATGYPVAKLAARVQLGSTLSELGLNADLDVELTTYNVKEPVFPFSKFPGVDPLLGPEMKSTGEVMGRGNTFGAAFAKAKAAAGMQLPGAGRVFISVKDSDKLVVLPLAKKLHQLGFKLFATHGTASFLNSKGLTVTGVNKVREGSPHCVEMIQSDRFQLVINTVSDPQSAQESLSIRRSALERKVPYATVLSSARAMIEGIEALREQSIELFPLEAPSFPLSLKLSKGHASQSVLVVPEGNFAL